MLRRNFLELISILLLGPALGTQIAHTVESTKRKTNWIGPRGYWSDPNMWSNGVPNEQCDAYITSYNRAKAICVITENAQCKNLIIDDNAHLEIENDLYISDNFTINSNSSVTLGSVDSIDWVLEN